MVGTSRRQNEVCESVISCTVSRSLLLCFCVGRWRFAPLWRGFVLSRACHLCYAPQPLRTVIVQSACTKAPRNTGRSYTCIPWAPSFRSGVMNSAQDRFLHSWPRRKGAQIGLPIAGESTLNTYRTFCGPDGAERNAGAEFERAIVIGTVRSLFISKRLTKIRLPPAPPPKWGTAACSRWPLLNAI